MEGSFQLFFLLSGFCSYTGGTLHDYVLIQEQKTWDEAQAYCRENYTELATVHSNEDSANLREAVYKMTNMAWIGLYNDINSWRWSYQDEKIKFLSWITGEPNNYDGHEECGMMHSGTWNDWGCTALFPFVCYNEKGTNRFVFINFAITWKEAQNYCRYYYTDLAIIRNQTENNQVTGIMQGANAWIGLFRDAWKWSDATIVSPSFITWMTGQPDMVKLQRPCGVSDPSGLISDQLCSNVLPFLCSERRTNQQIVRVKVKSSQNLNDPEAMEVVLQWINQKLKEQGIEKDTKVTWNVQPNGKAFHKIENQH
ncbi:putative C-type lectin domain family 20 member A isoform X2 [Pseudorasbora parva]|uniref:putative C-type lectin domain family 20 member A isoform X2 n=1 Tax=Pseudorasbora parva TaxID=51549 RepID=UPI00351EA17B